MRVPLELDTKLRLLIQRQAADPSAIELFFEEVTRWNLVPASENYESIIYDATLLVRGGTIFWSPDVRWSPDVPGRDEFTWISARRARWWEVAWLGPDSHYGPGDAE
ncbi:MAG: hypothetical protein AB1726_12420 [Planctomycetota bacterium]